MQIVINNYFKQECDVNTSIREAFEKGFRIGVKKGLSAQPHINCAECIHWKHSDVRKNYCEVFDWMNRAEDFCSFAEGKQDDKNT